MDLRDRWCREDVEEGPKDERRRRWERIFRNIRSHHSSSEVDCFRRRLAAYAAPAAASHPRPPSTGAWAGASGVPGVEVCAFPGGLVEREGPREEGSAG